MRSSPLVYLHLRTVTMSILWWISQEQFCLLPDTITMVSVNTVLSGTQVIILLWENSSFKSWHVSGSGDGLIQMTLLSSKQKAPQTSSKWPPQRLWHKPGVDRTLLWNTEGLQLVANIPNSSSRSASTCITATPSLIKKWVWARVCSPAHGDSHASNVHYWFFTWCIKC